MEKEFVTYEQALALKELGFDEPCLAYWINETPTNPQGQCIVYYKKPYDNQKIINGTIKDYYYAPLYQQAFRFFREKYKLHVSFTQWCGEKFYFNVTDMVHPRRFDEYPGEKLRNLCEENGQEEIETKALDKLIEIVKKNS